MRADEAPKTSNGFSAREDWFSTRNGIPQMTNKICLSGLFFFINFPVKLYKKTFIFKITPRNNNNNGDDNDNDNENH